MPKIDSSKRELSRKLCEQLEAAIVRVGNAEFLARAIGDPQLAHKLDKMHAALRDARLAQFRK